MKKLILQAALCAALISPAGAVSRLDHRVESAYNVRYFDVNEFDPEKVNVFVIWYDRSEAKLSAERVCALDDKISTVWWGDLGSYNKHHQNVRAAAQESFYECEKGR
ncbi:hypothetical protein [Mesorhizobium sp. M7A.F.Ca.MR.362.00.0.0]|uniref:hypothetical protein n=1 Tax=Mesorhizobium sp. M7A.F.Ca.MR.362.00.0.0 TaxID=2496779 RepID=UPI000FD59B10|nr:hypothetical protein [Mesorhizobium sp. M7A.F.Ca.MR.362.00.0.0]RUU74800.1 hypothetical protein EOC06_32535 [Mesorhizobium sp. M7A.F.Ca.MR.362.00.0.0]RWN95469.1 MAG: hypothetical protein EOS05_11790 [Mesorhizobium sp.]